MPLFPKIDSPCPYRTDIPSIMDGDFCRMCERKVYDLTDWSDGERSAFLANCEAEVCVTYRVPLSMLAATFVATALTPTLAAATPGAAAVAPPAADLITVTGGGRVRRPGDLVEVPLITMPVLRQDIIRTPTDSGDPSARLPSRARPAATRKDPK